MSGMRGGGGPEEVDLRRRRRREERTSPPRPLDECGMAPFFSIRRHIVTHERTERANPRKARLGRQDKFAVFESRIFRINSPAEGVEKNQLGGQEGRPPFRAE